MDIVAHRARAMRDRIVDREVRRLELQRDKRETAVAPPPRPEPPRAA